MFLPRLLLLVGLSFSFGITLTFSQETAAIPLPAPSTPSIIEERLAVEFNPEALRRAAKDLATTYPDRCKLPDDFERKLAGYRDRVPEILKGLKSKDPSLVQEACRAGEELLAFGRSVVLSNPLLDFDKILLIRRDFPKSEARSAMSGNLGLVTLNSHTPSSIPRNAWENEIAVLSHFRDHPRVDRIFKPEPGTLVRDLHLDFDGKRLAFSSREKTGMWAVNEIQCDGSSLRQLTPNEEYPDVDFFGPCYLPNGKMLMSSNASYEGLPCEGGGKPIANLYLLDPSTKAVRQLAFDQDSDAYPTVLGDGRVMFLRWEYSDIPHYFSRRVMTMKRTVGTLRYRPDGSARAASGPTGW